MKYKYLVLTRLQNLENKELMDSTAMSVTGALLNYYKEGSLEKFMLWDPSMSNQGKHVNDLPYRFTATLWKDEEKLGQFIQSTYHKKAMALKHGGTISGFKVIKSTVENSESIDLFTSLKKSFADDFLEINNDSGNALTNDNAEYTLGLMGLLGQ